MTIKQYPIIIGLGYKARRGKDSVANAIIEARGGQYDIRRYAFADALREEVDAAALDKWVQNFPDKPFALADPRAIALNLCDSYGQPFDPKAVVGPNYPYTKQRSLLQWWGGEYRRGKDTFYWVNKLRARIEKDNPKFAIITDIRYRNEVSYIRSFEGYTVKLDRAGYIEDMTAGQRSHTSEVELDSAPDKVWTHHIVAEGNDLNGLKAAGLDLFDSITASLTFPLLDELIAKAA